jgi:acyl-[acyl-carrier-protein]-phospholipid O-acyltransferase/long-chain-fatty-acid--[acyl-carrier-protein] ligase
VLSLWRIGKVPAILNFSTGTPTMLICSQLAGLKRIITSRAFLERARLKVDALTEAGIQFVYLEDIRAQITGGEKFSSLLRMTFNPNSFRRPANSSAGANPESTINNSQSAVVLFTSGSEGVPKGVALSHVSLLANMRQMLAVTDIKDDDRMFNCLPLFHSFGLTVGTLLPLMRGLYTFIYPSPLHYRMIPAAFYETDCTIFLSTNTFLNGYARKANPYDFRSMRYLFAAAEKLQETTFATWSQKFGVRVLEGYGATECSPCLSVNTPLAPKYGSVGRLLPGMEYKLEHVEGVEDGGRMLVRGPNIMQGYLNADADAKFKELRGWYDTGDIVSVDPDGYLFIRGRLKRFAKVSGEMVSLTAVEDALAGAFPQYGMRCQVAVVTRPDEGKGEVLIAVTNEPKLRLEEIRAAVNAKGLGNLSVPREIKVVREIPKLGTGKVNHLELAAMLQK